MFPIRCRSSADVTASGVYLTCILSGNDLKKQVTLFTTEYVLRFYSIVEAMDSKGERLYSGVTGRLRWAVTDFYSWVDLASIVPFYVDRLIAEDLPATQFIR